MSVLVTGAAGFIGYHVAEALLARGERVVGVDNLNEYYDVRLKQARLARLERKPGSRSTARMSRIGRRSMGWLPVMDRSMPSCIWQRRLACGTRWSIPTRMCSRT